MRRYVNQPLAIGADIILEDEDYNYIVRVLRHREGDSIVLFNGEGGEYHGIIIEIAKRHLTIRLKKYNPINRESRLKINILQSLVKGEKMDFVLQKGSELGMNAITPIITERSVLHLKKEQLPKRLERWHHIITSACEQCGLNLPPTLHAPVELKEWLEEYYAKEETLLITLSPTAEQSLGHFLCHDLQTRETMPASITFIIGPEGGLSEEEIEQLQKVGAHSVTLGPRILRTETAALSVISTLQGIMGDWSESAERTIEIENDEYLQTHESFD
ncbi:16S rRNA (uracil(1498)-N(3))-methyltransferase [Ignatzschineria cameli]|uniref:Ribosomal RNA small subunit methyltransferase E n=1 Tax=Ignatzschineria cameli TaxID=2182793 RepID=A0A2U2AQ71_9GAMM|nr:16S rRNA (uracil(1498)-N(3))-methyltransferase [Ignatzschineria cameli]PWD82936.1 16S rRNA (uracil(1498)-N(3))-methyltransferase [Ignatzschineria cameli]PWD85784.1 16S rRNA (uracil(1498)-N(3))-methyltransferase [Ignatzschineria cameli]PWD89412.1 16S rRNA (uracil(1498)-N(3))-methyltransferase [Ignatzschineria cameli]PWD90884.1 16S rRNA (uracil(1498)-N(3))-methyltransferase [Ignatzschineria cameli]PWD91672.1 16S rRNA (uracil(1498)-N(3))-methyltransferase [Ignatzschineria cameli]